MQISIIVARSDNNAIGYNNQLLWHLPADLRYFKQLTSGHAIIMGRLTYQSIGRPLPNRTNIVISRQTKFEASGCIVVNSLQQALDAVPPQQNTFIIGGAQIYELAFPFVQTMYITEVHQQFQADTFFPSFSTSEWQQTQSEHHQSDEKNPYSYTFTTWQRK